MWVADISRSSYRFRYELFDPSDGRVFVEAETVQVMYDYAANRTIPLDPAFLALAREYAAE
jgi:acyl-CoA thioesterase FadM